MQKMKTLSAIILALLCTNQTIVAEQKKAVESDNIIKLNLSPLVYRTVNLQYERILGEHTSGAIGISIMPKGGIPFLSKSNNINGAEDVDLQDSKMSVFKFTPEFRYYTSEAGRGFYFAPYLQYRRIHTVLPINYLDNANQNQKVDFAGNMNSFMFGLMIGSQFEISDNITLDWYIIGAHVAMHKVALDFKSSETLSAQDQADLNQSFEDAKNSSGRFNNLKYGVTSNSGFLDLNYLGIGIRGGGINIGYRF